MSVLLLSPNGVYTPKTSLASAVGAADTVGKTIVVTSTEQVTVDLTVPAGVALRVEKGGKLVISTNKTLTINGSFEAGVFQCFDTTYTGSTVVFGGGYTTAYYEWWGTFAKAVAATASTIVVTSPVSIASDLVVPSTVSIRVEKGGLFTIASGKTLTLNGPFSSGLYKIFDVSASGASVRFPGYGGVSVVNPEWWGAKADSDVANAAINTKAINAALAVGRAVTVQLSSGTYCVDDMLNNACGARTLKGPGGNSQSTGISSTSTTYILNNAGSNYSCIENINFVSDTAKVGLYYTRVTGSGWIDDFSQYNILRNVNIDMISSKSTYNPVQNATPDKFVFKYPSNLGTVALYVSRCEISKYDLCSLLGAVALIMIGAAVSATFPLILTTAPDGATITETDNSNPGRTMSDALFDVCTFSTFSAQQHAIIFAEVADINLTRAFINTRSVGTIATSVAAIRTATAVNCNWDVQLEDYNQFIFGTNQLINSEIAVHGNANPSSVGATWTSVGYIDINNIGTTLQIVDNKIRIINYGAGPFVGVHSNQPYTEQFFARNLINVFNPSTVTLALYCEHLPNDSDSSTNVGNMLFDTSACFAGRLSNISDRYVKLVTNAAAGDLDLSSYLAPNDLQIDCVFLEISLFVANQGGGGFSIECTNKKWTFTAVSYTDGATGIQYSMVAPAMEEIIGTPIGTHNIFTLTQTDAAPRLPGGSPVDEHNKRHAKFMLTAKSGPASIWARIIQYWV